MASVSLPQGHATILFDGVCNFCNASINFVMDHDAKGYFRFASLQSRIAERLQPPGGSPHEVSGSPDSIVLLEAGIVYKRSTAVLRIARQLSWPWSLLYVFILVPRPIRDYAYRWVAANRYRWFGKSDTCRLPTPELRDRFLE
jgi:predicted DCC family thiol-disulfide oxidoreductase YuxK